MMGIINKILVLGGGNLLAQLINTLSLLILAYIYDPENYSLLALFTSILTIFTVVGCLRYEQAMLVSNSDNIEKILSLCLFFQRLLFLFSIILVSTVIFIYKFDLIYLVIPFLIHFSLGISIYQTYELKVKNISKVSKAIVFRALIVFLLQLFFGFYFENGLIYGLVFGLLFVYLVLKYSVGNKKYPKINTDVLILFKNYPKYYLPFAAASTLSINSMIFIIGKIFGSIYVGYFFLAEKIVKIPSTIISLSLRQILTIHFSESKESSKLLFYTILILLLISGFFGIILYIFSRYFLNVFFDPKWSYLSDVIIVLIPWMIFTMISTPLVSKFISMDKINILFYIQFFEILLKIFLGFYFYWKVVSFTDFLYFYNFIALIQFFLYMFFYFFYLKKGLS